MKKIFVSSYSNAAHIHFFTITGEEVVLQLGKIKNTAMLVEVIETLLKKGQCEFDPDALLGKKHVEPTGPSKIDVAMQKTFRFFRMQRAAFKALFDAPELPPLAQLEKLGIVIPTPEPITDSEELTRKAQIEDQQMIDETQMANPDSAFDLGDLRPEASPEVSVVAMVGDSEDAPIKGLLPNPENVLAQLEHAAMTDTLAMENFMRRVKNLHAHSTFAADDLLRFIKNNELPLAENGDIVAFRVVYTGEPYENAEGEKFPTLVYRDKYTSSIPQGVGAEIRMPGDKVDNDSRRHCSHGLHVANRRYLKGMANSSTRLLVVSFAPEDVIAVPRDELTKIRVCAYRIWAEIPAESAESVIAGTGWEQNVLVQQALQTAFQGCANGTPWELQVFLPNGNKQGLEIRFPEYLPPAIVQEEPVAPVTALAANSPTPPEADATPTALQAQASKNQAQLLKKKSGQKLQDLPPNEQKAVRAVLAKKKGICDAAREAGISHQRLSRLVQRFKK